MTETVHLHLVSDSTGETVTSTARACLVQFPRTPVQQHLWCLVRTKGQVHRVISAIQANPGLVLYTLVDDGVRRALVDACRGLGVPHVSVLDPVMDALGDYLGVDVKARPGRQHVPDAAYFDRIDAIHYTIAHDDGQGLDTLEQADVVVVGVSRTSKTPTCMYLANRGLATANVPLVPGVPPPSELLALKSPLVVGLTRDAKGLSEIRRNRLRLLTGGDGTYVDSYADPDNVKREITEARRLCARHGWPMIDVTRRSIEEAAAAIVQMHASRSGGLVTP